MKKNYLKILASAFVVCLFLFLAAGSDSEKKESDTTESTQTETNNGENSKIEASKPEEFICNICSSKFTGRGYELTYDGNCKQVEEPYQGYLCSCTCAKKARKNFDKAVDDAINYNR